MRTVLVVGFLALCLASAASAKLGLSLLLSTQQARVGQPVQVIVRMKARPEYACRPPLLAVAPGADVSTAIEAFFGGGVSVQGPNGYGFHPMRPSARLGFKPRLERASARTWWVTIRFPRAGRWRLVVPNECAPGWMYPWPAMRRVEVRR